MTTKRIEDNENGQPSVHVHVGDDLTDVEGHAGNVHHRADAGDTSPTGNHVHRSETRDDDVEGHGIHVNHRADAGDTSPGGHTTHRTETRDDDVEGHGLPTKNPSRTRDAADDNDTPTGFTKH